MKQRNLYTMIGFFMLVIMSVSLVFSTLHSHHHIQWNHPGKLADTGNCFTTDTTVCPICGYLFNADIETANSFQYEFSQYQLVQERAISATPQNVEYPILGRSPPLAV